MESLKYLSREGLLSCVENPEDYCTACFGGDYPLLRSGEYSKDVFDRQRGCGDDVPDERESE